MIKCQVIGNLGSDAEVKEAGSRAVMSFNVCHTETFKNKQGEKQTKSVWVKAQMWGELAKLQKLAQYFTKGLKVYVEGEPAVNAWISGEEAKSSLIVNFNRFEFLGGGQRKEANDGHEEAPEGMDDLPF